MPTTDEIVPVIEELIEHHREQQSFEVAEADRIPALVAYALSSVAVHTAAAALYLHRGGFDAESMPLARLTFETGVTAQYVWHFRETGTVPAVGELGRLHLGKLVNELKGAAWDVPTDAAAQVEADAAEAEGELSNAAQRLRNFETVCKSFTDGPSLYVVYRVMSGESHTAGGGLLTRFLGDDAAGGLTTKDPRKDDWTEAATSVALGLMLAWSSFDAWQKDTPHAQRLTEIGARIGMPTMLTPKPESKAWRQPSP